MPSIGFPIPTKEHEFRRALLPQDFAGRPCAAALVFETGYGACLGIADDEYRRAGARVADRGAVCECPIICNPKPMLTDPYFAPGRTLFGWLHAVQGRAITDRMVDQRMTGIAWEDMFERDRHVFWRNNEIAGEAAVTHALILWGRVAYEARAAVIGRGNCAHGATRTLERLGCQVDIFDRRRSPHLREELDRYDIVVNAVLWDIFRTDHLIYESDLERMRPGSLIIDISCDERMGIESSRPTTIENPVYVHRGIVHYAVDHTPALFFRSATEAISAAARPFIEVLAAGETNAVLRRAVEIEDGRILDDRIRRFQQRA